MIAAHGMTGGGVDEEIVARARQFVADIVTPRVGDLDGRTDPAECFDWSIFEAAHDRGLRTLVVSAGRGGGGANLQTLVRVGAEFAKGDLGVAAVLAQLNGTSALLEAVATEGQVERLLPKIVTDPHFMTAVASTEVNVGSDATSPVTGPHIAKYETRAVRRDEGWVLNGHKQFIDNGSFAKLYLVMAQTDPEVSLSEGSTCFLVEGDTPGVNPGKVHDKLGQRLAAHAEVSFVDCAVTSDDVLGRVNGGGAVFASFRSSRALLTASTALGVAEAAYERTMAWLKTRVQGGRRLIEHEPIRLDVIRLRMRLDVVTQYIHNAAAAVDAGGPIDPTMAMFAKVTAGEVAYDMAHAALELHGGRGYMREYGVEKLFRDAASFAHIGSTDRTMLLKAARLRFDDAPPRS